MMTPEKSTNHSNNQLEERLSTMHEQLAGVTSRLDRTERELDLECATREDTVDVCIMCTEAKARASAPRIMNWRMIRMPRTGSWG